MFCSPLSFSPPGINQPSISLAPQEKREVEREKKSKTDKNNGEKLFKSDAIDVVDPKQQGEGDGSSQSKRQPKTTTKTSGGLGERRVKGGGLHCSVVATIALRFFFILPLVLLLLVLPLR